MIKNVIFDLGRVIYNYWPREYLKDLGYDEQQADRLMECIFDNSLWLEMDRGLYTLKEGAAVLCKSFPEHAKDIRRIMATGMMNTIVTIMPQSLEFFLEVKRRGYKTYVLSNFSKDGFADVRKRDAFFFNEVDGVVVSAHEKLIKPDPAIYHRLLNRYVLVPEECIFIDDVEINIRAAAALGIHGIVFTNIEDCKRKFDVITGEATL